MTTTQTRQLGTGKTRSATDVTVVLGPVGPAAGWFDDPTRESQLRFWDGTAWTVHTHEKPEPVQIRRVEPVETVEAPPRRVRRYDRSRAGTALLLSILGLLFTPFAIAGWAMANAELREIAAGRRCASGSSKAVAARTMGIICVVLSIVMMVIYLGFLVALLQVASNSGY